MVGRTGRSENALLLTLITNLSVGNAFTTLFDSVIPFSMFPVVSLILAICYLRRHCLGHAVPMNLPNLTTTYFVLNMLLCDAMIHTRCPSVNSGFFPTMLSIVVIF